MVTAVIAHLSLVDFACQMMGKKLQHFEPVMLIDAELPRTQKQQWQQVVKTTTATSASNKKNKSECEKIANDTTGIVAASGKNNNSNKCQQ